MSEPKDREVVMLSDESTPLRLAPGDTRYQIVSAVVIDEVPPSSPAKGGR